MGRIIKVNPKFGAFEIYIASWVLSGFFYSCMIAIGSILEGSAGLEESISNFDGSFAILVGPVLGFFMGITFGLPGLAICKSLISSGTSNVTFYVVGAVLYGTTLTWILISFFSGFNGGEYSAWIVLFAIPASAIGGMFFGLMVTDSDKPKLKNRWGRN